ncbi:MAG: hypothetical protein JXA61_09040 [Bacteroidales bacterium]|nr:hypothetical protein [Bacteroidales bacterium]
MKTKLFFIGLALTAMAAVSSAQEPAGNGRGAGQGVCTEACENFVDNNNNGICDNYEDGRKLDGTGYRKGLAWIRENAIRPGYGQGLRYGQGRGPVTEGKHLYGPGRGPAAGGKHLYGPGNRVINE